MDIITHGQVRRPNRNGGEERVPEDRGQPRRVGQRVQRHAGHRGAGYGPVGAGGAVGVVQDFKLNPSPPDF